MNNNFGTSKSKWTKALWDPNAGVETSKPFVMLGDASKGNNQHLVLVNGDEAPYRLRLYKGLTPIADSVLSDAPAGIVSFVSDSGQLDSPCLAVAVSSSLLIFRNMKPYYRYNIPQLDILPAESDLWNRLARGSLTHEEFYNAIQHLREQHSLRKLSFQSQQFLTLEDGAEQRTQFLQYTLGKWDKKKIFLANMQISCLAKLARHTSQASHVDVLVVGTELGSVYFVDSQVYTILHHTTIDTAPIKILLIGTFDIEFRAFICTREHDIFILHKNKKGSYSQKMIYIREYPFDVVICGNQVAFATRKRRLVFFSTKGKRQNSLQFDVDIADVEHFFYEPRQFNGILVALGSEVHLYVDQILVDTIRMSSPIEWLKFGKMGGEEGVLVIATEGGGLFVKIFRRVATFDDEAALKPFRSVEIPKKSKLFVEQSLREQANPQRMHQVYQRDWFMIKYHAAKTFADLESGRTELMPTHESEPLQITYDVLGFGPNFRILVRINSPVEVKPFRRWLCFFYNAAEYSFARRVIELPSRLPLGSWLEFANEVVCLHPESQLQHETRIVIVRERTIRPLWSVVFEMPLSESEDPAEFQEYLGFPNVP